MSNPSGGSPPQRPHSTPFASFWQAGFEGADHINHAGRPLDMNDVTGHLERARADYEQAKALGMRTMRESIGWRLCERDGKYDFSLIEGRLRAAQELGLQATWTLCHYGWPEDVDLFGPDFVPRFARYCRAAAEFLAPYVGPEPVYSPINEISFSSWGLSIHMFRIKNMHHPDAGGEGKRQLVRATIAAIDAIREVAPGARFLQCDPLIHVIAPEHRPDWAEQAAGWRESQFEALDMLCGRQQPELGGADRYLDIIGGNYYHSNQWESGTNLRLWWHLGEPRRMPLYRILMEYQQRYDRPFLLAETSHVGSGRGIWIREMAEQAALAVQHGVDFQGICLYPVIDRPDWENEEHWHHSGLWDLDREGPDPLARVLVPGYAMALRQAMRLTAALCEPTITRSATTTTSNKERTMETVIVFCHLRWDFVYQRPQQLLTRLAQHYKVLFVEEPLYDAGPAKLTTYSPAANITVCQPHTPVQSPGFHDDQIPVLQPLLEGLVPDGEEPIVWFYTPMALPLLAKLHPSRVVYDCMDELSAFKNPPKQLLQRETALLNIADLVFTGGPSLYEAKRSRHASVHCFPSSVDAVHFEQALDRSNGHPLHQDIARPRLGFYGVLDERLDAELIGALADAHPEWQIVLVGPVVKIDPASLPQRQNVHYLGQHPYQALPHFLAGWDVCLLPFALNEATRYISPTKVLEYMAARLPTVSTAITDVEKPYGDIVAIGHSHEEFIAHCEAALAQTPEQTAAMAARMAEIVAATSWDATADRMRDLIERAPPGGQGARAPGATAGAANVDGQPETAKVNPLRAAKPEQSYGTVIIGAGPTGLSAAYHLGANTLLMERNKTVGGWCRSITDAGFTFDHAGHIMFSNDPYVLKLYDTLLGDNQHWQMREAWIYSKQVFTRYPFQGALYGLPPDVIKECIVGAVEARYGTAANEAQACAAPGVEDCCADGTADVANSKSSAVKGAGSGSGVANASGGEKVQNFEDFIYQVWGAGIAKHFAIPYNKKLWTVPLSEMETSWLGGRVPLPDLGEIIDGALQPVAKPMGPNARFGYPKRGGFQSLMNGFLPHIRGKIELNADAVQLLPSEKVVALSDGRRFKYERLISTMPLPELVKLIGAEAPEHVRTAARGLRHVSIRCVNIGIARSDVTDKHWIYYPEDSIFHRIFVQGNASPECNAPGGFGFTCEISYSPWKPLPLDGDALVARCIEDCIKVGMMRPDDKVLTTSLVDMPYAYVVYDQARAGNVAVVRDWLDQHGIVLAGRYSEWEYYNSDHAFLAGKKAAETVSAAGAGAAAGAGKTGGVAKAES